MDEEGREDLPVCASDHLGAGESRVCGAGTSATSIICVSFIHCSQSLRLFLQAASATAHCTFANSEAVAYDFVSQVK